jgi:hypothetical protein
MLEGEVWELLCRLGWKGKKMIEFMEYVQNAFYNASNWNLDNSYSKLTATAQGLHVPLGCVRDGADEK